MWRRWLPGSVTRRIDAWLGNFVTNHTTLEWLLGLAIMLVWAVIAFARFGPVSAGGAVVFGVILHYVAMETGSHAWLWFATGTVIVYALVAYGAVLEPLGPLALTAGGASALAYNETVRLNYARRRDAAIEPAVFVGSTVAVAAASMTGVIGIGLAVIVISQSERDWVWMPAAVITLMLVAYALVILPTVGTHESSGQRWVPGRRLPTPTSPTSQPDRPAP